MDREVAEDLMRHCMEVNTALNGLAAAAERVSDKAERDVLKAAIGNTAIDIYLEIMRPVIRKYPDLDPDK